MAILSDNGRVAFYRLHGLKETMSGASDPVFAPTISQYNDALNRLNNDVGLGLDSFRIEADEIRQLPGRVGGQGHVNWTEFMSKLNGALSFVYARVGPYVEATPFPRESLRPVLMQVVEAHYRRPPESSGPFMAGRTNDGLALYPNQLNESPIAELTWEQINQLQDGGFLRRFTNHKGHERVSVEEAGMRAYNEMVRLQEENPSEDRLIEMRSPMNNKVWVIHGHDLRARDVIFALLAAVGLEPLEFDQAADLTGKTSPSIMEVLRAAFAEGQAFVALFTHDEDAVPSEAFADVDLPGPHPQPRPNVVLEAGMAFAYDPDRTIIVEMGRIREISDLGGIHGVRWTSDSYETRKRLLRKLKLAKCPVNDDGDHWVRAGGSYP